MRTRNPEFTALSKEEKMRVIEAFYNEHYQPSQRREDQPMRKHSTTNRKSRKPFRFSTVVFWLFVGMALYIYSVNFTRNNRGVNFWAHYVYNVPITGEGLHRVPSFLR
jgi:hypothetical protein